MKRRWVICLGVLGVLAVGGTSYALGSTQGGRNAAVTAGTAASATDPTTSTTAADTPQVPDTTDTSLCGAPSNPYGYNLCGWGDLVTSPPSDICNYFNCIASFWEGSGYMVQCNDGSYGLSGGHQGTCSLHGGEGQPVSGQNTALGTVPPASSPRTTPSTQPATTTTTIACPTGKVIITLRDPQYQDNYGKWTATVPATVTNNTTAAIQNGSFQGTQDWQITDTTGGGTEIRQMGYLNDSPYTYPFAVGATEPFNGSLDWQSSTQPTPVDRPSFTGFFWNDNQQMVACPKPEIEVVGWDS